MEKIWIDASEFDNYGGFILETQFVREMGQAYLMANGVGEAVKPAEVTFHISEGGKYRLFIRTKNWCSEYKADGLVSEIDGIRSKQVSGIMNVRDWYFEVGGDFELLPGKHTLKIYDTCGWFARFSAVVMTNDYNFTPSRELSMLKRQRAEMKSIKNKPQDLGEYDLIVVGAGVGGIVAAISAARYGLKTALINDRPCLGGNASEEANISLDGSAHRGFHETGIVFEIKSYKHKHNISWSEAFSYFSSMEKNLDIYLNTLVFDATAENGRITEIFAVNTLDMSEYKLRAPLFVDATGDGWLGYYAGANYRVGREAKFQHNESFAPECADGNTMSGCNTVMHHGSGLTVCGFLAEKTELPNEFNAPKWAFRLPEGEKLGRIPSKYECGEWWLEMPNDYDDLFESEFVRDSMIRLSLGYFNWLKNAFSGKDSTRNYVLKRIGTYNAKRESRRIMGDYIISENDYTEGKEVLDAVGYCGWNIDVHHPQGIFSGEKGKFTVNKAVPITPIPFGALYSENIDNLMMVGRCISVTHIGLGPARVQLTAGTMGQAVGTAAYLCKKKNATPREIRKIYIDELQQMLLKDGMLIPGVRNHDKEDLAPTAKITATSHTEWGAPENVSNGIVWKGEGKNYAWVSDVALPQSIELAFDRPTSVHQVRLTFDIPFDKYRYGYMEQPIAEKLVEDFLIFALVDETWQEVACVKGNIYRNAVVDFEPKNATSLRVMITKTADNERVIIPEIRIY